MSDMVDGVIGHFAEQPVSARTDLIERLNAKPIVYGGQRCVTDEWIEAIHGRPKDTVVKALLRNQDRFVAGKHFYDVPYPEWVPLLNETPSEGASNSGRGGYRGKRRMWTERGYCLVAKVFDDDRAWDIQEALVDGYFGQGSQGSAELATVSSTLDRAITTLDRLEGRIAKLEHAHVTVQVQQPSGEYVELTRQLAEQQRRLDEHLQPAIGPAKQGLQDCAREAWFKGEPWVKEIPERWPDPIKKAGVPDKIRKLFHRKALQHGLTAISLPRFGSLLIHMVHKPLLIDATLEIKKRYEETRAPCPLFVHAGIEQPAPAADQAVSAASGGAS